MWISVVRAGKIFGAVLLICAARHAAAAPLDPRYGAGVELDNFGTYLYEDQTSAGGSVSTGPGGAVLTEGAAGFSNSPPTHVNTSSIPGRGVIARAYLFDSLTFHVAGGGSAQVPIRMAGNWTGHLAGTVDYYFVVGPTTFVGRASPTGFKESYVNGAPTSSAFTFASGDYETGVIGTYSVNALLNASDGVAYTIFAQVRAQANNGAGAYMDDPITIELPAGVTFSSASGNTYAVPEPSACLLIGGAFLALARRRPR